MNSDNQVETQEQLTKTELFDVDMMEKILTHDGVKKLDKNRLKNYKKMRRDGNKVDVVYRYGKAFKKPFGRMYPERLLGLQDFPSDIRGALAQKYYWDIDMVNSQPSILLQICEMNNWKCDKLREYVENRSDKLHEIMESCGVSRDEAKTLCIAVMFGGSPNVPNSFLKELESELQNNRSNFIRAYPEIFKDLKKQGKSDAQISALILQDKEFKLLRFVDEVLAEDFKRRMDALIHDGGLVRRIEGEEQFPPHILRSVEAKIKENYGFKIRLEVKPLTHSFEFNEEAKPAQRIIAGDKEAGDLLYAELKDSLIFTRGNFYMKSNQIWTSNMDTLERDLRRYVMESKLRVFTKDGDAPYSQKTTNAQNCLKVIMDNAVANRDDMWEEKVYESSRGMVLFQNGYYDMKRGEFISTDDAKFDSSIVFTEDTAYHYDVTLISKNYIESIYQRFFTIPFGEDMGAFYLLKLARGLAWDREKKFLAGIGSSNTGKSAIASALKFTIGGYFGTWNGANICYKQNSSQDEAQKLRWTYLLRNKRIIVSNELQVGGLGIDGNMIKKLSNGGFDDLVAREHGGNETSFKVGFLPILFAQDLDKIRPMDDAVMTRLKAIHYQKVYVDEPSNELELKIDRGLEMEMMTPAFRMNFIQLMFNAYFEWNRKGRDETEPECVKLAVKEVVGTESNIIDAFLNEFEMTDNGDDFVKSSEIEEWMNRGKFRVTMTKFGMEMNKFIKIRKFENVESKNKKIGGKVVKCWFGIRLMTEDDEKKEQ